MFISSALNRPFGRLAYDFGIRRRARQLPNRFALFNKAVTQADDSVVEMKLVIADDHAVYRAGLAMMLQQLPAAHAVVEAASLDDALVHLATDECALGIFDLDMPGMHGPQSIATLNKNFPRLQIVVLSASTDEAAVKACVDCGCRAFIPKTASLFETLRIIGKLLGTPSGNTAGPSPRQLEVLRLVATGLSNKEIARQIGIAPGTVKAHLASLFALFNVRNRTELLSRYPGGKHVMQAVPFAT